MILSYLNKRGNSQLIRYFEEVIFLGVVLVFYLTSFFYSNFLLLETKIALTSLYLIYCFTVFIAIFYKGQKETSFNVFVLLNVFYIFLQDVFSLNRSQKNPSFFKDFNEKRIFLFFIVKLIFIPIMLNFLISYILYIYGIVADQKITLNLLLTQNNWFFWLSAIVFGIDTLYFSFGYIFEHKSLKNRVKSVDSSVLGWMVALACYLPFNNVTIRLFPMLAEDQIYFINEYFTTLIYIGVFCMYLVYLSSTIALGFKCSNLTNRGIISKGPYRIVRHPAYVSKVIAWWLLSVPIFNLKVLISMIAWTLIYLLRAYTEEKHLMKDEEYIEYTKSTKYQFIPYVY